MDALSREIPMSWYAELDWEGDERPVVTVPDSAKYHVYDVKPYNFRLKLREGYQWPTSHKDRIDDDVIAYFEAEPDYPWWYFVDVFDLREREVIALHGGHWVRSGPSSYLAENNVDF